MRQLVLHREHVGEAALITFGPEMPSGQRIDQLRADAHAIAVAAHAALQDVARGEFLADAPEELRTTFAKLSVEPIATSPGEFARLIKSDFERWGP
ncbi:MAG: hypothetical protein ACJ8GO_12525, partial [Ramlibacter sp.]